MSDRAVILNPQRLLLAEFARQDWIVNAEAGTTVSDVLDPQYWAHCSAQMKPYDRCEVRLETGEWMLELIVLQCDRNWAKVHLLEKYDLTAVESLAPAPQKHIVKWRGPQHKHCVVRISDNEVLSTGHETGEAAQAWLKQYETTVAF